MKKQKWEIHSIFECKTCGKQFEERGRIKAVNHAKKHRHIVSGEIAYYEKYDFSEKGDL